jgi:hypothetical protein
MSDTAPQATCGHEHEYGGIAYRCERAPHSTAGHEERHRHAARIDAGYAREIGDVDGEGTPDLLTWDGGESGDGDNTEVAWGTVAAYGAGECAAPGQAHEADPPSACFSRVFLGRSDFACGSTPGHAGKHGYRLPWVTVEWDGKDTVPQPSTQAAGVTGQAEHDIAFAVLAADRNTLREILRRIALGQERDPSAAADKALAESRKRSDAIAAQPRAAADAVALIRLVAGWERQAFSATDRSFAAGVRHAAETLRLLLDGNDTEAGK